MKIRITKKGLPKAQYKFSQVGEELQLTPNQQPNYNWTNFGQQPIPKMPMPQMSFPKLDMSGLTPPRILSDTDIAAEERPQEDFITGSSAPRTSGQIAMDAGIGPDPFKYDRDGKQIQQSYNSDPVVQRNFDENLGFGILKSYLEPNSQTSRKALRNYVDFFNNKYDTKLKMPLANPKLNKAAKAVSAGIGALSLAGSAVDYFESEKKKKEWDRYYRQQMMASAPSTEFEGIENINSGRMFENMLPKPNQGMMAAEYGGSINNSQSMKIRITSAPRMEYGGQADYALDLNRRKVYTDMPESRAESISGSISAVPRDQANIEAEGGETVYGDLDGDGGMEHLKIKGPRHSEGGVPLNVPEGSFIFSDFAKMKIKDPEILKYFGLPAKKGGYTPAEIAKRYDINKYKAIIEDENADEINKTTAQIMVKNYQEKLGQLSMIQESMKDFPQGMPKVAQESMGENQEDEQLNQAKYGGSNLPSYQTKGRVSVWDDEEQKALQEYIKKKYNVEIPINARDTDPNSQRFTLPTVQSSRGGKRVYGDEDWISAENIADFAKRQKKFLAENPGWDPTKKGATEKFQRWYDAERVKKGLKPYFGKGQKFQAYDDMFGEYTFSAPDIEPTEPVIVKDDGVPGFICLGLDDKGYPRIQESSYKNADARTAAGAYASKQEASLQCPGEPIKTREFEKPKEYPAKYWTPDNWALGAAALFPPKLYTPFVSDMQFRPGQLALEDWLSQAQNIQQTYNTSANTLGNYQPGTALASNLSFLAGTAGDQVSQAISQVGNRNVDRFNNFSLAETQRKQGIDAYNTAAKDKRWDYMTGAKQNLDNARRKYVNGVVKAATNRFANRMYTDMINKVNPIYNMDPTSGLSYFKQGWDWSKFGNNASSSGSFDSFPELKSKYLKLGMSEANAEKVALDQIKGGKTTYTDSDMDGYPNSARMTAANQMNYMNQLLPAYMSMMNIGRNAYSYNDE